MAKNDLILETLLDVRQDVGQIKEHLETLNGKVATNVLKINDLEKDSNANKLLWAKVMGVAVGASTLISLLLKFIL